MKMWEAKTRVFSVLGLLVPLLSGCTVGPQRPLEAPKSSDEPDAATRSAHAHDPENYVGPEAEFVGAADSKPALDASPTQPSAQHGAELGHATITLGPRPPWSSTASLEESEDLAGALPTAEKNLSTRWRLQKSIWVGQGYLYQAEFTPDQKSVVTLSTDNGVLYHYDVASGRLLKSVQLPEFEQFEDAAFAMGREVPGRPQVVVTRPSGTSVLDLESGKFDPLSLVPAGNGIEHSGRFGLYGVSFRKTEPQSGSLLLQWITGETAAELKCDHRPDDWALSTDGTTLALQYYPSNTVEVLDLKNLTQIASVDSPKWGGSVALSPDGTLMALGGEKLVVVSLPDGKVVAEDSDYNNNINDIRFSPQGDLLLVSAYDGKARSYALPADLSTLTALPRPQLLAHGGSANVYGLGLSSDTKLLVTSSGDKSIKIWAR